MAQVVRAAFGAFWLFAAHVAAHAQETSCEASCPVPCMFGQCPTIDASPNPNTGAAPCSDATVARLWANAQASNDCHAYIGFRAACPSTPEARFAQEAMRRLRCGAEGGGAASNTAPSYEFSRLEQCSTDSISASKTIVERMVVLRRRDLDAEFGEPLDVLTADVPRGVGLTKELAQRTTQAICRLIGHSTSIGYQDRDEGKSGALQFDLGSNQFRRCEYCKHHYTCIVCLK